MKNPFKVTALCVGVLLLNACATYKSQYQDNNTKSMFLDNEILHSFYLLGDGGNSELGSASVGIKAFEVALNEAPENSTAIFLGDNIYPDGLSSKIKN